MVYMSICNILSKFRRKKSYYQYKEFEILCYVNSLIKAILLLLSLARVYEVPIGGHLHMHLSSGQSGKGLYCFQQSIRTDN